MKKNIILYVAITLLACALTGTITYILVDKKDNKAEIKENDNKTNNNEKDNNQNEEPTKEDGVKLLKTYNLNDKIVEEFEITLNGKTNNLKIDYNYEFNTDDYEAHLIVGKFNNTILYFHSQANEDYTGKYKKEDIYNLNTIKNNFNKDNFEIIKGTDNKNYLIVTSFNNTYDFGLDKSIYIYNENLELISKDSIIDSYDFQALDEITIKKDYFPYQNSYIAFPSKVQGLSWYDAIKGCQDCEPNNVLFKVENNKIYYLALIVPSNYKDYENNNDLGFGAKIEEREYTINNNKLEYKVIKEYKVLEFSNLIY